MIDKVIDAYKICALWASPEDEEGELLDSLYTLDDLSIEAAMTMQSDVEGFLGICAERGLDVSVLTPEQVGHDFFLTRNRHGAGFWDRGLGELGEKLSDVAHSFGDCNLYAGDDGKLYVM